MEIIAARRSIRRFEEKEIPPEVLQRVMEAAIQAPSGKNKQPWRFIVAGGTHRDSLCNAMSMGIDHFEVFAQQNGISRSGVPDAKNTLRIMRQAPIIVLVLNEYSGSPFSPIDGVDHMSEIIDTQSIGAAIQNMLLAATDQGLGSLWICNTTFAYDELSAWIGSEKQLVAAVALGYPAEAPGPRPRLPLASVVEYRL